MKRKTIGIIAAVAAALVAIAVASPAWAYFTDNDQAAGGFVVPIVPDTDIDEPPVIAGQKQISIVNNDSSEVPVMVRAKVYFGDNAKATVTLGDGWSGSTSPTGDGDVYTYSKVLAVGEATSILNVKVELPAAASEDNPGGAEAGDNFNVIVTYEATPFIEYDDAGNPTPTWSSK